MISQQQLELNFQKQILTIMNRYKIFYLDDEKDDLIQPIKRRLEQNGLLEIVLEKPKNFETELDRLSEILKGFDALILDLQLDGPQEIKEGGGNDKFQVRYQAPPLAQTIRTLASERYINDLPIILCSTERKIKDSFSKDFTSHNLFDWTFLKEDIDEMTINKIVSLISGYQIISDNKSNFNEILKRNYSEVDERILSRFINEENPPTHEIARVIFKDIVQCTGVLIDEANLAARLGIDSVLSGDSWDSLLEKHFNSAKYTGVYHQSWSRWWNDIVIDIFEEITNENLASLNAETRVSLLIEHTEFKTLKPATTIELCESNYFWSICEITQKPIDPFEAFKINPKEEPKPWQDYSYVSLFGFLTKPDLVTKKGIKIHPSDTSRLLVERKKLD